MQLTVARGCSVVTEAFLWRAFKSTNTFGNGRAPLDYGFVFPLAEWALNEFARQCGSGRFALQRKL